MRAFDRDLIRGGHYGQRSWEPHQIGRTHGCTDQQSNVKILLANSEPSTHGTSRHFAGLQNWVVIRAERTWTQLAANSIRSRMTRSRQLAGLDPDRRRADRYEHPF